ncbi:peroxide stress protein YaaA [Intrasporangium calvum]|uniref:Peroxide stress protein YaaA n=1 Tax=Intrasporangium calvum TaxID=53358 RepID=A0ABT5GLM0_9MICO|nr:peroxide stress protein YaaA [Intrasporangium calvum]MDC5698775.1 peroxide stress protein YaaA [Intrasporangium calvum]
MLILLPPSEGKTQRRRGRPLDLATLSFPELTSLRSAVIDSAEQVSARPDAHRLLSVSPNLIEEVARNTRLRVAPTAPAAEVYSGVLFDALDLASLDPASKRRANRRILIFSALFGVVRPTDRIPAYRLNPAARLPDIGDLTATWREVLTPVLEQEAGDRGLVVDCRSGTYTAMWSPKGALAERRVHVTVPGASHMAKHTRGLVARHLVQSNAQPRHPEDLVPLLEDAFVVRLSEPERPGRPWQLAATARA